VRNVSTAIQKAAISGNRGIEQIAPQLLGWIAHHHNLRCAYDHLAAKGGHAAGPDGIAYKDLDNRAVCDLVRLLSGQIVEERYKHGPVRTVSMPKSSGHGARKIAIANISDRIVSRAISQILEPALSWQFDRNSFARVGLGLFDALATADAYCRHQERRLWIVNDIANAFGSVPIQRLLQILRQRIPCKGVCDLVKSSLGNDRKKGLRQGPSISPLLMNLYLDHLLDRPWRRRHPKVPLLRFMDDLLVLCAPDEDTKTIHADLCRIVLDAGLCLKYDKEDAIHNLGDATSVDWLGFRISTNGRGTQPRLKLDEPDNLKTRLFAHLMEQHRYAESPQRAVQVIEGMVSQLGPAYLHSDHKAIYAIVQDVAHSAAFEEIPNFSQFCSLWKKSHDRWERHRNAVILRDDESNTAV
jgi:retron-type reverse transcriptase